MNTASTLTQKIILGIDETTNIEKLLDDGIRQFYFGYIQSEYLSKYASQTSLNRRYRAKEQFSSLEKAFATIETIHKKGGVVSLALNSFTSNSVMKNHSLEVFELFKESVDSVIAANITIASMLKSQNYKNIVISNLFGAYTTQAVAFLIKEFDPVKIILPRDIALKDIETIVNTFKDMEFESFLFGDNCRFSESFCFSEHGYDTVQFGSLCSYALQNSILVKPATPAFKHIIKNTTLCDEEKKELLQKRELSIPSLLDTIEIYLYENNIKEAAQTLEILSRFDIEMFYRDKRLYIRTLNILKNIDLPKAQELYLQLQKRVFQEDDNYKIFHKINSNAIAKTIKFFEQFSNISSYKIPSRGRDFYKYLLSSEDEPYHYKESQYNHETLH